MKFKLLIFSVLFIALALTSCDLFSIFERPPYSRIYISLINKSNKPECGKDSMSIVFKVSNLNAVNPQEVITLVKTDTSKFINVVIKKDEFLLVKVLNPKDSSLILEKKYKSGEGPNTWNDPPPRIITFCGKSELKFENF